MWSVSGDFGPVHTLLLGDQVSCARSIDFLENSLIFFGEGAGISTRVMDCCMYLVVSSFLCLSAFLLRASCQTSLMPSRMTDQLCRRSSVDSQDGSVNSRDNAAHHRGNTWLCHSVSFCVSFNTFLCRSDKSCTVAMVSRSLHSSGFIRSQKFSGNMDFSSSGDSNGVGSVFGGVGASKRNVEVDGSLDNFGDVEFGECMF